MPGLIRGVARTAVVAGTATAVSNRVSRRQANRWAAQGQDDYGQDPYPQQQQQYAPPPEPAYAPPEAPSTQDTLAELQQLGELHQKGILTDEEFNIQKAKILARA